MARYVLDFGAGNGQLTPPTFAWFRDATTHADLSPPSIFASPTPAWTYYFDFTFPVGTSPNTTAIDYGVTLAGVSLTDVISNAPLAPTQAQPLSNAGAGGSMTLADLRNLIRTESDTENDPHISDTELTTWINRSRFRLYGKLVTSFGDDYYSAKAQFTTDGTNTEYALPDGILYGAAPAFFKGQLLEAIAGGNVQPNAPVTLLHFNLREKNRFTRPFSMLAIPGMFPRARIVGSKIVFTPLPSAGLTCQLWYAPRLSLLVNDTDVAEDFNGWLDLVVIDCAVKAINKQERDPSTLLVRGRDLMAQLDAEIANRNIGEPNTVIETSMDGYGPFGAMGPGGAWGGGYY